MMRPCITQATASARSTLRRQLTTAALPRSSAKSTNAIRLGLLGAGTAAVFGGLEYFKELHGLAAELSPRKLLRNCR